MQIFSSKNHLIICHCSFLNLWPLLYVCVCGWERKREKENGGVGGNEREREREKEHMCVGVVNNGKMKTQFLRITIYSCFAFKTSSDTSEFPFKSDDFNYSNLKLMINVQLYGFNNCFYQIIIICLPTIIWLQVTNNNPF